MKTRLGPIFFVGLAARAVSACGESSGAGTVSDDAGGPSAEATLGGEAGETGDRALTSASSSCDPLAPRPTALGAVLGIGQDLQSTVFVADEADSGQTRVFVSSGRTLERQVVLGSGERGNVLDRDYTLSFAARDAGSADARALLIQIRDGSVTAMALGPGHSRTFYDPDAGDEALAVVDASVVDGDTVVNLPSLVEYVVDVSDGHSIVVTEPMDAWGYSEFHIFYGASGRLTERAIVTYNRSDTSDDVSFDVDGATYTAHFTFPVGYGNGEASAPGPEMLDEGDAGKFPMTARPSTTLSGLAFLCLP